MENKCNGNCNCADKDNNNGAALGGIAAGSLFSVLMGLLNSSNNSNKPYEVKQLLEVAKLNDIDIDKKLYLDIIDRIYGEQNQVMPDISGVVSDLMGKFDISKLFGGMVDKTDKVINEDNQTDGDYEEECSEDEVESDEYENDENEE